MRLTIRNSDGTVSQPMNLDWSAALEKLAAYEDAEDQGRLVILPCKVGDTVYAPTRNIISEFRVSQFDFGGYDKPYLWMEWYLTKGITGNFRMDGIRASEIGKTVFLTREEAEAALKGESLRKMVKAHKEIYGGSTEESVAVEQASDVRPVVRGKWTSVFDIGTVCNQCGYDIEEHGFDVRTDGEPNFCPNCGADMREES